MNYLIGLCLIIYAYLISPPITDHPDIHYYEFAMLKCTDDARTWTIHGLWPQHNNTVWPEYCKGNISLNLDKIRSLIPKLNMYWTSCYGNNEDLWKHEWVKHGSCSNMTEFEYFNTTLELYKQYYESFFKYTCSKNTNHCIIPLSKNFKL